MKDFFKKLWQNIILRLVSVELIIIGGVMIGTGSWITGLMVQIIGWILNYEFYEYKDDEFD